MRAILTIQPGEQNENEVVHWSNNLSTVGEVFKEVVRLSPDKALRITFEDVDSDDSLACQDISYEGITSTDLWGSRKVDKTDESSEPVFIGGTG